MKNLKIKFGLFSLLAILAVSVFLTSCEQQEAIVPDTIEGVDKLNESITPDADAIVFTLPERFDNMSEEELQAFFEETSEEDIMALSTVVDNEIESRWCGSWYWTGYRYCSSYYGNRWRYHCRRYCTSGYQNIFVTKHYCY